MTPGQFLLKFYHTPVGRIRDSFRNGGPLAERETERQRREMEAAAASLPPLPARPGAPRVQLHLLTGRRFWYQTAFCLHSFARHSEAGVAVLRKTKSWFTYRAWSSPAAYIRWQGACRHFAGRTVLSRH